MADRKPFFRFGQRAVFSRLIPSTPTERAVVEVDYVDGHILQIEFVPADPLGRRLPGISALRLHRPRGVVRASILDGRRAEGPITSTVAEGYSFARVLTYVDAAKEHDGGWYRPAPRRMPLSDVLDRLDPLRAALEANRIPVGPSTKVDLGDAEPLLIRMAAQGYRYGDLDANERPVALAGLVALTEYFMDDEQLNRVVHHPEIGRVRKAALSALPEIRVLADFLNQTLARDLFLRVGYSGSVEALQGAVERAGPLFVEDYVSLRYGVTDEPSATPPLPPPDDLQIAETSLEGERVVTPPPSSSDDLQIALFMEDVFAAEFPAENQQGVTTPPSDDLQIAALLLEDVFAAEFPAENQQGVVTPPEGESVGTVSLEYDDLYAPGAGPPYRNKRDRIEQQRAEGLATDLILFRREFDPLAEASARKVVDAFNEGFAVVSVDPDVFEDLAYAVTAAEYSHFLQDAACSKKVGAAFPFRRRMRDAAISIRDSLLKLDDDVIIEALKTSPEFDSWLASTFKREGFITGRGLVRSNGLQQLRSGSVDFDKPDGVWL
jgi:hypothetical protein